jgi:hypothetical protein
MASQIGVGSEVFDLPDHGDYVRCRRSPPPSPGHPTLART